ncbi:hypothetical protein [Anoxybacteroides tepidamans]|uniref:hypothetical protein n=1 Tax=Anoxybacteroides tepidamans TaxID=265948 RepID=UPI00048825E9|nr:hypothetical protein [Anoxybacillus tepidamans]
MEQILVTGVTGNVGREVAEALKKKNTPFVCGVRNVEKLYIILMELGPHQKQSILMITFRN